MDVTTILLLVVKRNEFASCETRSKLRNRNYALRALRGQVDQQRITNGSLSADLSSIRAVFNEKEKELSVAAAQVEELTRQLEQFSLQAHHAQAHPGSKAYFVQLHLERLRAELMYRNKLNDQKAAEMKEKKARLIENRENVKDMETRMGELRERLQRKKMLNQQLATQLGDAAQKNNKILTQQQQQKSFKNTNSQVAAIEPFNRQQNHIDLREDDVTDFTASKNDAKYQTLPHNTRFLPMIFNNNTHHNSSSMKGLKIASVPPQVAEKPALPPKPAMHYKPLLPPRQNPEKEIIAEPPTLSTIDEKVTELHANGGSIQAKSEMPLKPKPLTLMKHSIQGPPPPPPLPSLPPSSVPAVEGSLENIANTPTECHGEPRLEEIVHSEESTVDINDTPADQSPNTHSQHCSSKDELFDDRIVAGTNVSEPAPLEGVARRLRKGNLKSADSQRKSRRVSFDPLALLLDASLEGELELVQKTALEVSNPSAANDEGITALHNAICAGHLEIVRFLVELGCDVNAQDSDGWTPLHCAASCNNLAMVKFLVEHGACIFAATLSDQETAAEKCEEDEEGFDGCSEYLYSIQEKLGILNNGKVSAVYEYEAQNSDELSFEIGDELVVLRKGDDFEREWWWSRHNDREGYVPRNLLGLYPRMEPVNEE